MAGASDARGDEVARVFLSYRREDTGQIADATPPESEGVSLQRIATRRPCLFLFDAFNEVPEHLHRNCAVALRRFDTWGERHRYILSSRAVPGVEPLAQPPASFTAYDLLRLSAEQVEAYLTALGLAALHERIPEELQDLVKAAVDLLGAPDAIAERVEASRRDCILLGHLDASALMALPVARRNGSR